MNNFSGIGNLTRDVELRYNNQELAIATFTIAINRYKKQDGTSDADFIRCTAFGKKAEVINKYMSKGKSIGITGHLHSDSYETQNGERRYTMSVIVDDITFIGSKETREPQRDTQGWDAIADEMPYQEGF